MYLLFHVSANGDVIIGKWYEDNRVGEHILTTANGDRFSIIFEDDEELSRTQLT